MRRAKSLRIGVHHANGVVWGPVYRTHLSRTLRTRPRRSATRARGRSTRPRGPPRSRSAPAPAPATATAARRDRVPCELPRASNVDPRGLGRLLRRRRRRGRRTRRARRAGSPSRPDAPSDAPSSSAAAAAASASRPLTASNASRNPLATLTPGMIKSPACSIPRRSSAGRAERKKCVAFVGQLKGDAINR